MRNMILPILAAAAMQTALVHVAAAEGKVIELTQTACQFIEPEHGMVHGYTAASKADCERINKETADARLEQAEVMTLAPGSYTFRVTNKDVAYPLGFWLRGEGLGRLTLPSVSGGGLSTGATKDYEVELEPGEYVFSCPLNSTPDYKVVVTGG